MLEMPVEEEQRHEHRDVRQDRREDRRPHFLAAVDRRRHAILAVCSMCRNEFSSTTIAASTIMPTPSASPPNVIVFSVRPAK